jgi:hypothetical protein
MQTNYGFDMDVAFAGMPVDAASNEFAQTKLALESLDFGKAAMRADVSTYPNGVRTARRNLATAVFSADLVTSNSVAGSVNGVALTATVFATDHATTMAAIGAKVVAALLALGITAVATVGGASNRTLTIAATDGSVLLASFVVTLGGSQATVTLSNVTSDTVAQFAGVLLHTSQPPRTSDGLPGYAANDAVACLRQGRIWVPITANVSEGEDAYVDFASGSEGKFTNVSTAPNVGPVGKFIGDAVTTGLGLAKLEVNLP